MTDMEELRDEVTRLSQDVSSLAWELGVSLEELGDAHWASLKHIELVLDCLKVAKTAINRAYGVDWGSE